MKPKSTESETASTEDTKPKKPVFRPKIKAKPSDVKPEETRHEDDSATEKKASKKPVFRPKIKPKK